MLADRANEAICFVVARWRAEPKTEASVKTHRGPTTTGRLTREMRVRQPEVHPKPVRLLSNKSTTNEYSFVIFRAAASFTASLLSTEPSTPSSRTLQPKSRRDTVTSSRHRDAPGGGGASTPCGMTRSCKHRTAPTTELMNIHDNKSSNGKDLFRRKNDEKTWLISREN